MNTKLSIITIATLVLVIDGMAVVPTIDNQVHGLIIKDSSNKVKNFVKSIVGMIFERGSRGGTCQTCP